MNALEIRNLNKEYKGFALRDLSLSLPSGCILGLIGENGAGKSTTIKLILDMIRKDSGSISLFGEDNLKSFPEAKEEIGVVLDEVGFPECLTARQINRIMKHTYRNWREETYFAYLKSLDMPLDKQFKKYSKGMKMKLGIAVALSHEAKLLILDEATSGLDPVVREQVVELLLDFTREESHSVLISSHIVSDLEKLCDYVAFLHKGKLLLCEEKDVLTERYGILHGTKEQIQQLDPGAVIGRRSSAYGVEAIVDRRQIPAGLSTSSVGIEDLFVFMVKEAV